MSAIWGVRSGEWIICGFSEMYYGALYLLVRAMLKDDFEHQPLCLLLYFDENGFMFEKQVLLYSGHSSLEVGRPRAVSCCSTEALKCNIKGA